MSTVAGGFSIACALTMFIIGGAILKLTFSEDNCFSRWWPRSFAIILLLQGLCLVIIGAAAFVKKTETNALEKK